MVAIEDTHTFSLWQDSAGEKICFLSGIVLNACIRKNKS